MYVTGLLRLENGSWRLVYNVAPHGSKLYVQWSYAVILDFKKV